MKLYILTNMYIGGTHPGIQGIHSAIELVTKYTYDGRDFPELEEQVVTFTEQHKTVVMLRSGMDHTALQELVNNLDQLHGAVSFARTRIEDYQPDFQLLPFAEFKESGLNNTITSVAILCTSEMVNDMAELRKGELSERYMVSVYGEVVGELLMKMAYMGLVS